MHIRARKTFRSLDPRLERSRGKREEEEDAMFHRIEAQEDAILVRLRFSGSSQPGVTSNAAALA